MSFPLTGRQATLFSRLARYRPSELRNAREDRLTEALAATLEACPSLARRLVADWFGRSPSGALTVKTQMWAGPTERIDLELLFGPVNRPEFRAWFESKVDAKPEWDQMRKYQKAARKLGGEPGLSWLLRTGVRPEGEPVSGVGVKTWQDLATLVAGWLRDLDDASVNGYPAGLAREFVRHLEEKEGLAVTQPLNDDDVAALDGYNVALARLREILELARHTINDVRSPEDGTWSSRGVNFWFWEVVSGGGTLDPKAQFQWHGDVDIHRADPAGKWVVGVGATWNRADAPSEMTHGEWFDNRYEQGFELSAPRRGQIHLCRYMSPSDLAKYSTLDEQGSALASWALETWALLVADPLS